MKTSDTLKDSRGRRFSIMHGIEINSKYVKAFRFGKWPNGKAKWCVGRWEFGDNVTEFIYPENFESKEEAQAFIAKLNLRESED